uniref:RING-type domain-containing protein n=1 Tax=Bos indicus x Bos taurus TaxID=30522 RepID=A0A4W2DI80_BOBOX
MAAPLQGRGQSEANLLGHFECSVCLEMSEKPVQLPCERIFCPEFLQECLKPKKPLCALCCNNWVLLKGSPHARPKWMVNINSREARS